MPDDKAKIAAVLPETIVLEDGDALRLENITLAKALVESRLAQAQMVYQAGMAAVTAQHGKWAKEFVSREGQEPLCVEDLQRYDFDIENKIAKLKAVEPTPG